MYVTNFIFTILQWFSDGTTLDSEALITLRKKWVAYFLQVKNMEFRQIQMTQEDFCFERNILIVYIINNYGQLTFNSTVIYICLLIFVCTEVLAQCFVVAIYTYLGRITIFCCGILRILQLIVVQIWQSCWQCISQEQKSGRTSTFHNLV